MKHVAQPNSNDDDWQRSWTPIQVDPLLDPALLEARELHAEPFWMQDIRLAQRRLEAQRGASKSAAQSASEGQETS
ncbi:MAG TPA: hypothetical protein VH164_11990 [Ktedonobacteraceae bacterium]|jgi:hypothetical protein|nr:hypothetical protein [Ktedonobacteraceae bacterium]